ncbi:hypothetical protein XarbCFBP8150_21660, partial [Xanthomonas arboricola]
VVADHRTAQRPTHQHRIARVCGLHHGGSVRVSGRHALGRRPCRRDEGRRRARCGAGGLVAGRCGDQQL